MNLSKRLMPEYIRLSSWLMIFMFFLFPLKNILSQDKVYNAPDVSIFSEPEQVFELPGSGDYIGPERLQKYNFSSKDKLPYASRAAKTRARDIGGVGKDWA